MQWAWDQNLHRGQGYDDDELCLIEKLGKLPLNILWTMCLDEHFFFRKNNLRSIKIGHNI